MDLPLFYGLDIPQAKKGSSRVTSNMLNPVTMPTRSREGSLLVNLRKIWQVKQEMTDIIQILG